MSERHTNSAENQYIVAIGASAGGLEAIHEFFDNMPESDNLSYVIIQHLSPDYKSLLVDLVSRHTEMKVYEAENNLTIFKNCIYVIPNNKFITIQGNKLVLSDKVNTKAPNNAVDVFLQSLAKEKKTCAIAVILSGTGTDGTKGAKAIKDEGGLVIVQEPVSAKFNGMPNSVISSGNVDHILAPADMPEEIINFIRQPEVDESQSIDDSLLQEIFELIRHQAGFEFHYYKTPTITRRIFHRMMKVNRKTVEEYIAFLQNNPEECKQLGREFLINVTRFFRDKEAFAVLRTKVLPSIMSEKQDGDIVKLWICACSTGEEAYSLAILVDQVMQALNLNLQVKIFASDIERSNIEIASRGLYPKSIEADVEGTVLNSYFTRDTDGYQIIPRIRKQIVFAQHNVIKDPPFIKNDLVSCRNMLIYMNSVLQQRVYSVLLFAANRGGYIFLGTSENATSIKNNIEEVDGKWKIYKKIADAKFGTYLPDLPGQSKSLERGPVRSIGNDGRKQRGLWDDFKDTLFNEFNFAAFYIDNNFEIKEAIGNFDKILSLPKKILKLNLLRMLPSNVSAVLINEIKHAWKEHEKRVVKNLQYKHNGVDVVLQVLIKSNLQGNRKNHTLVAFHFMQMEESIIAEGPKIVYQDPGQNDYVFALEEELNETKNNLQHAIEDLETTNEELQSSNEELLSANEELQSSNEELQSLNEELHTLNTEHQIKIKELIELNDDLTNYFRSSNIGQVFLDKNLSIRKFNPASSKLINFIETDVGRPITHISTNIRYDRFITDIELVLKKGETIEKEVQLNTGQNILLRIMPYITVEKKNAGVIISFIDITTITNLNNIIRGVFNSSISAIVALEAVRDIRKKIVDLNILTANHAAETMLGKSADNIKGTLLLKDLPKNLITKLIPQFFQIIENNTTLRTDIQDEANRVWYEVTAVKMADGIVTTFTDITHKKVADERLRKNYGELIKTKEDLKRLNSDLEQKVAERTRMLSDSEERFRLVSRATNDAIWDWSFVDNSVWFSEAFYSKFGYDRTMKMARRDWLEKIHPDDRREVEETIFHTINSEQKQWSQEYRFRKADGSFANILDRGYVLHDDYNTPYRMLGSMLDLTDLKQAEQVAEKNIAEREFMIDAMPLMVWTANESGVVDFVNKQFEAYTGLTLDESTGDGWKKAVHPLEAARVMADWKRLVDAGKDFQMELRLQLSDKNYHWNLLRAKARRDEHGKLLNWLITTIDIQEQKLINERLEEMVKARTEELLEINRALEVSNHDLQQFASVASHDLQEPLRKIHMFAKMINDRYKDKLDGASNYLQKIMHSSVRMKSIISNILNFSKLSATDGNFVSTDLNQVIGGIIEDFEIVINDKKAQITIDQLPVIEAIPGQIQQVFQNIIGNALKFSKEDTTPEIEIRYQRVDALAETAAADSDGNFARITIQDNGIGFGEEFAENIFVIFHRLHTKDKYDGTGIGLAIVKKIIEKHNGLILAEGREGKGAKFTIILPLKQEK